MSETIHEGPGGIRSEIPRSFHSFSREGQGECQL